MFISGEYRAIILIQGATKIIIWTLDSTYLHLQQVSQLARAVFSCVTWGSLVAQG